MSEASQTAALSGGRAALVRIAAAQAAGDEPALRAAMEESAVAGPAAVEEVLLQSYLFLGFPAAIWGLGIWRSLQADRPTAGDLSQDADAGSAADSAEEWRRAGEALCARVYGSNYEKLRRNVRVLHPALDSWMITEGYGKVLSRTALDPITRELCVVGALGASGWEAQLHSHLRGALNLGAEPSDIEAALEIGLRRLDDEEWRKRARGLWQGVRARHVR